jgi:hypothetical protein
MAVRSGATATAVTGVEAVALTVQNLLGKFSSAFLGMGLSILLGVDPLPTSSPFAAFWADNRVATVLILAIIVVIGVASLLITQRGRYKRPDQKPRVPVTNQALRLLRALRGSLVEIIVGFLAGLLLGVASAPSTIPVLALIRSHPAIGFGLGALLLLILIIAPLIGGSQDTQVSSAASEDTPEASRPRTRLLLATATSLVTTALLFSLVGLVTIRPAWCPTSICPAPQLIIVTNPNGVNDGVMEAYDLAQQGDAFVMTQDPASYTFDNLPSTLSAVELGVTTFPSRAVIGIHSLQRNSRYGLIIDGVDVLLDKAMPVAEPVSVFLAGASLSYNTNVSNFTYKSQLAPPITVPTTAPAVTIELEVGGSDDLAVQVMSQTEISLQFRLLVRYHQLVGDPHTRTLIVPHAFGVDFIAPAHWQPYIFAGGKMTPQPKG